MTEHNQEVFNTLIEDLERQRLRLFRSAAQLDEMIESIKGDAHTYESSRLMREAIAANGNRRMNYLYEKGLDRDEETEEILKAAIGNFEV